MTAQIPPPHDGAHPVTPDGAHPVTPDGAAGPLVEVERAAARGCGPDVEALVTTGRADADADPSWLALLAAHDRYAEGARHVLMLATARVDALHAGDLPYSSDAAFGDAEVDAVWRSALTALHRDEDGVGELLTRLLPGVCVAPTTARTAPSQAAAIALGKAVATCPTPESVAALREARRVVRHAGLAKKLDRLLRAAERALPSRPQVARRLAPDVAPTASALTTAVRALEGGFVHVETLPWERWCAELAQHPHLAPATGGLVWDVLTEDGRRVAVRPVPGPAGATPRLVDAHGARVPTPTAGAGVRLWHPAGATEAERDAWRTHVVAAQVRQPFRQVFREHHAVADPAADEVDDFAGHVVALRPLLGLAAREGWRTRDRDGVLVRDAGAWQVAFELSGPVYPGADGAAETGRVLWFRRTGVRAPFSGAPPVVVSEALRGVDLLVSVAGVALDVPDGGGPAERPHRLRLATLPLGTVTAVRRAAVQAVVAGGGLGADVRVGPRHVHVGPFAVHLATARVTRDGAPVTVEVPTGRRPRAAPWLPYDEALLDRVVRTVVALQDRR